MPKQPPPSENHDPHGPNFAGILWSPSKRILKTFATNSIHRYLDDVNNTIEQLDAEGRTGDFGVVYYEDIPDPFEKAKARRQQLALLSANALHEFVKQSNPDFKILIA